MNNENIKKFCSECRTELVEMYTAVRKLDGQPAKNMEELKFWDCPNCGKLKENQADNNC